MGLFERISDFLGNEQSEKQDTDQPLHEQYDMLLDPELLEDMVNVEKRSEIIATHYDSISSSQALTITEIIERQMTGYEISRYEAKKKIRSQTDVSRDLAEAIYWTETRSIQTLDTARRYQEEFEIESVKWMGPGDDDVFPGCREVENIVAERGGSIPLGELQNLLRQKAEKYAEQGGTPERMDHWVPHRKCRYSLSPVVGPNK